MPGKRDVLPANESVPGMRLPLGYRVLSLLSRRTVKQETPETRINTEPDSILFRRGNKKHAIAILNCEWFALVIIFSVQADAGSVLLLRLAIVG